MVKYICPTCTKEFSRKNDLVYHTDKKKKPCQPITLLAPEKLPKISESSIKTPEKLIKNEEIKNSLQFIDEKIVEIEINNDIACNYCGKKFCKKSNLNRHLNTNRCIVKRKVEEDEEIILIKDKTDKVVKLEEENVLLKNEVQNHKKEIQIQKNEIEELKRMFYEFSKTNSGKRNSKQIINTNNSNNTQNNIQTQNNNTQNNNINIILPYGKELENIKLNEVLDHMVVRDFDNMLPKLVKYIYLNKDKPQNQNFVVNDIARNKCQYYDGEKWITGKANDQILKLFENTNSLITDPFDKPELEKTLKYIRDNVIYQSRINTILENKTFAKSLFDESDKENLDKRQEILDELKLIFYSHRDEILKITL